MCLRDLTLIDAQSMLSGPGGQTPGQPSTAAALQPSPSDTFVRKETTARALEAKLREVSRNARNFYDQPVRQLRARLRDAYVDVLLEDPQAAQARPCTYKLTMCACCHACRCSRCTARNLWTCLQAHEIDTALWKWVYYKPIEEFRHRVRFAADAGEKGEEPLRRV